MTIELSRKERHRKEDKRSVRGKESIQTDAHTVPADLLFLDEELGGEDDRRLPPRKIIHPSEKGRWTSFFYRTLLLLFFLLIVSIIGIYLWNNGDKDILPF